MPSPSIIQKRRTERGCTPLRRSGGSGKPIMLQAMSWAPTEEEAEAEALHQWASKVAETKHEFK
jgi:hypothetical protein